MSVGTEFQRFPTTLPMHGEKAVPLNQNDRYIHEKVIIQRYLRETSNARCIV